VKRTQIQDGCTVAFGATVMGGAVIERDTTLLPLSLVLKEMNMTTATYEGSPAEPVSSSNLPPTVVLRRRSGEDPELPGYRPEGSVYEAQKTSDDA
jgi:carbonic anhydrase/acetyltransferase-like protein (isoleucine patch superfamily)